MKAATSNPVQIDREITIIISFLKGKACRTFLTRACATPTDVNKYAIRRTGNILKKYKRHDGNKNSVIIINNE